jgi:cobalt/nickel transport protein
MVKTSMVIFGLICWVGMVTTAHAHFGMLIPSTDLVTDQAAAECDLKILFAHPFEGVSMDMERPETFGVYVNGQKQDLRDLLQPYASQLYADQEPFKAWQARYKIKRPGDYIFYVEPQPYWEPAEDCFIKHYTKVVVDAFGKEDGWDAELGLKTEIVPLTRPFGLYAGNVFQGIVKVDGQAVPYSEVEVEYFNEKGTFQAPASPFITQVIKCDGSGVFTFALPQAGWWGFAALNEDTQRLEYEGEEKSVEIGAVLWVKAYDW